MEVEHYMMGITSNFVSLYFTLQLELIVPRLGHWPPRQVSFITDVSQFMCDNGKYFSINGQNKLN